MAKDAFSSSHPPLPPISEEDQHLCLRLLRSRRVGIVTFYRLLKEHGSAADALDALPKIAREAGIDNYAACPEAVIDAELKAARRAGARMVWRGAREYPKALSEIEDAPPVLWVRGQYAPTPTLALVGARNASSLGTRMTKRLAAELVHAGYCLASGLARGVDAVAHQTALDTATKNLPTIAVVAGGVDVIYPAENAALMDRVAERGAIFSEMPMGLHPQARHFPRRNRIISGLSRAVVVIEAAVKSGSLITAQLALDQGREVLAVPGHPFDVRAAGCNHLLRDGATLVRGAEDVLEALGEPVEAMQPAPPRKEPRKEPRQSARSLRETASLHSEILGRLGPSPVAEDHLVRGFDAPAAHVSSALVDLELDGQIERQSGGLLALKSK
ncbi:MAG: DNA-processing protein DprA [Pseudomonadota bacterium]